MREMRWPKTFSLAIKLDPGLALSYYNRGNVYLKEKNYDGAIADYNRAIQLNPKYAGAYNGRGLAKRAQGDMTGADADITQARRLEPNLER